jgi:uncharacterized protein (TIGR02001 family)
MAVAAGAAHAQDTPTFAFNVGLTSDYVFRGISQSDSEPAISAGADMTYGIWYAGVWASSIDFGLDEEAEVDIYGGVKPVVNGVTLDFGFVYYLYPGLDSSFNAEMLELKAGATVPVTDTLTVGAAAYWSPEFTFSGNESAIYAEVNASYVLAPGFSVSGAIGHQNVDGTGYFVDPVDGDSTEKYTTWNLGLSYSDSGFTLDGRWYDTDLDKVTLRGPSGEPLADQRLVGSVKFAF